VHLELLLWLICGGSVVTDFSRRTSACWFYKATVDSSWCRTAQAGTRWMWLGRTHPQLFVF